MRRRQVRDDARADRAHADFRPNVQTRPTACSGQGVANAVSPKPAPVARTRRPNTFERARPCSHRSPAAAAARSAPRSSPREPVSRWCPGACSPCPPATRPGVERTPGRSRVQQQKRQKTSRPEMASASSLPLRPPRVASLRLGDEAQTMNAKTSSSAVSPTKSAVKCARQEAGRSSSHRRTPG